ncbi:MAG: hypothetical protein ABIK62_05260 [candidate division WOR-3 bacterium]
MHEAFDLVRSKQAEEGRWALGDMLNDRFLVRFESRGKPSKWITLNAATVPGSSPKLEWTRGPESILVSAKGWDGALKDAVRRDVPPAGAPDTLTRKNQLAILPLCDRYADCGELLRFTVPGLDDNLQWSPELEDGADRPWE